MIQSFGNDLTAKIFSGQKDKETARFPQDVLTSARRKLDMIEFATLLQDLAMPPGNRLEKLKGALEGSYSIRINDQWRIVFQWQDDGAHDVRIIDYH
ncbi:MAG TPA: type II toxin-antitoxin system RelE/ParE family toxin [Chroococcales cyanobacterium]